MPQTSANVATNDVVKASDHNTCVADIASLFASTPGDASTTVKGIVKLNVAPSSPTNPVAIAAENNAVTASMIADGAVGQANSVTLASTFNTTSTSFVDVTGMSLTFTLAGGNSRVIAIVSIPEGMARTVSAVQINGVDYGIDNYDIDSLKYSHGAVAVSGLSAGSYTVKLRARKSAGGTQCQIQSSSMTPARLTVIVLNR